MTMQYAEQRHPLSRRILHWIMALSILIMIGSGWRIYNASPIFDFIVFPEWITLGGDVQAQLARHGDPGVASAIAWHFAAMWTLAVSYLLFLAWGLVTGHFRHDFLPVGAKSIWRDFVAALTFKLKHRLGEYNAVQKAAYVGVLVLVAADDPVWLGHLEAGTDLPVGAAVRRLSGCAPGALHRDGWDRAFPASPRRSHLARATYIAGDGAGSRDRNRACGGVGDKSMTLNRRETLRAGFSLSALTLLSGCDLSDHDAVQNVLARFSKWNDQVQAALFSRSRLAPTFPEAMAVKEFRYNAWYGPDKAPRLDPADYRLQLAGRIDNKRPWTVEELYSLPQVSQVTRHVCVEGWSMIGKWSGTPLRTFLERIGADTNARYVGFECADGYYEGIDMPTALHPQTIMAFRLSDEILPTKYGYPFKIRIPTKLGFKNPKFVTAIYVTDKQPRGYWTDRGYNWFSGI